MRRLLRTCTTLLVLLSGAPAAASDLVGTPVTHVAVKEDTFVALMERYGVGFVELVAANPGVDAWLPEPGTPLAIPTAHLLPTAERKGIVINLGDRRLYYFPGGDAPVESFPVGVGRSGLETPLGKTTIVRKRKDPVWIPTPAMREADPSLPRAVAAGPDNPLGTHALNLGWQYIVVHGTNRPFGVGRRVSQGCIRLPPQAIVSLFERVKVGTPVQVVDQPVKIGRIDGALHLEAHPTQDQADELEAEGKFTPAPTPSGIARRLLLAAGGEQDRIDWQLVERVLAERRGVPIRVTKPGAGAPNLVER